MRRFTVPRLSLAVGVLVVLACGISRADGQSVPGYWAPSVTPAGPPVTNQTRQVLGFYGGQSAQATLNEMPRRTPIQPAPAQLAQRLGRPFQAAASGPTISPYLNLFRDEDENPESVPNYFTLVRPQLEQQEANQRQQREIYQLQRQLRNVSATVVVPQYGPAPVPGQGTPARFMDTAQFYGAWQR
jgi:hypothetical protein